MQQPKEQKDNTFLQIMIVSIFLTIVLVVLKVTKVIAFAWLWVLAPAWIANILLITMFLFLLWRGTRKEKKNRNK